MARVSMAEFKRIKARIELRREKRLAKRAEIAQNRAQMGLPCAKRRRKTISARRLAFDRLARLCRTFVMLRNRALYGGRCEIAMSCGGSGYANTWYHGWPQKGGNGLKYDVRSHFWSCSACNMGEYGARMRGSDIYVQRHKALLGPMWYELDALKGRMQISTARANEMISEIERKISCGEWSDIPLDKNAMP